MPSDTTTQITFVLDSSGSMSKIREDTIGGFNTFLTDQRDEPGRAAVTLYEFSDSVSRVYHGKPLGDAPDLDEETYTPGGRTALHDAITTAVTETDGHIENDDHGETPGSDTETGRPEFRPTGDGRDSGRDQDHGEQGIDDDKRIDHRSPSNWVLRAGSAKRRCSQGVPSTSTLPPASMAINESSFAAGCSAVGSDTGSASSSRDLVRISTYTTPSYP
jgi:hypothetical protein